MSDIEKVKFKEKLLKAMKEKVLSPGTCAELSRKGIPQISRYYWIDHRIEGYELYHAADVKGKVGPWDDVYSAYTMEDLATAILRQ